VEIGWKLVRIVEKVRTSIKRRIDIFCKKCSEKKIKE
jgi:hypothetical protein